MTGAGGGVCFDGCSLLSDCLGYLLGGLLLFLALAVGLARVAGAGVEGRVGVACTTVLALHVLEL